jgi:hypothetical protein
MSANRIRIIQTGQYANNTNDSALCCWVNDSTGCDQMDGTIDYTKALFDADISGLKGVSIDKILLDDLVDSTDSTLTFSFENCGADCSRILMLVNNFTYVDGLTTENTVCTKDTVSPGTFPRQNCEFQNTTKPIKNFSATLTPDNDCRQYGMRNRSYYFTSTIIINMAKYKELYRPSPSPAPGPSPSPAPGPAPSPAPGPAPGPSPSPSPAPGPSPGPAPAPAPKPGLESWKVGTIIFGIAVLLIIIGALIYIFVSKKKETTNKINK